ncbi:MAG: hypothetical protein HC927_06545 [Deltaproteobacteria bacterium]|nr:hypothetical protein [Deltaproteobacteria bacterium]
MSQHSILAAKGNLSDFADRAALMGKQHHLGTEAQVGIAGRIVLLLERGDGRLVQCWKAKGFGHGS